MAIEKCDLDKINERLSQPIDLFICSASYEKRCETVAGRLASRDVTRVIVAENRNHVEFHGGSAQLLMETFGEKASLVALDTSDPLFTADSLKSHLSQVEDRVGGQIVVDITTFTRESLLILLALLRRTFKQSKVRLLYVNAAEYSLNEPDETKWLSRGIADVRSVLGFAGAMLPSRRLHLVVLVGFEYDRAAELIRAYEPSVVSLGYDDSAEPGAVRHRAAQQHNLERIRAMYINAQEFRFSGYDPLMCKAAIEEQVRRFPDANTVVAAMNTKLSTVGAALAAIDNESIQLCYAQAAVYNYLHYSTPGSTCYFFDF
jgi:hypothetical protein